MGASIDCKNKVDYAATGDSQEAAHGPEVDGLVVALARDGLRRQVLRGAAHREALELLLVRRGTAPPAAAEEAHAHRALLLLELILPPRLQHRYPNLNPLYPKLPVIQN